MKHMQYMHHMYVTNITAGSADLIERRRKRAGFGAERGVPLHDRPYEMFVRWKCRGVFLVCVILVLSRNLS